MYRRLWLISESQQQQHRFVCLLASTKLVPPNFSTACRASSAVVNTSPHNKCGCELPVCIVYMCGCELCIVYVRLTLHVDHVLSSCSHSPSHYVQYTPGQHEVHYCCIVLLSYVPQCLPMCTVVCTTVFAYVHCCLYYSVCLCVQYYCMCYSVCLCGWYLLLLSDNLQGTAQVCEGHWADCDQVLSESGEWLQGEEGECQRGWTNQQSVTQQGPDITTSLSAQRLCQHFNQDSFHQTMTLSLSVRVCVCVCVCVCVLTQSTQQFMICCGCV